jgi:hypothetical protein
MSGLPCVDFPLDDAGRRVTGRDGLWCGGVVLQGRAGGEGEDGGDERSSQEGRRGRGEWSESKVTWRNREAEKFDPDYVRHNVRAAVPAPPPGPYAGYAPVQAAPAPHVYGAPVPYVVGGQGPAQPTHYFSAQYGVAVPTVQYAATLGGPQVGPYGAPPYHVRTSPPPRPPHAYGARGPPPSGPGDYNAEFPPLG